MFNYSIEFLNNTLNKLYSTKLQDCGHETINENNSDNNSMFFNRVLLNTAENIDNKTKKKLWKVKM